jgi:hypothetical protein
MAKQVLPKRKKIIFNIILFLVPLFFIIIVYIAYTTHRTTSLYLYVKSKQHGWKGKIYKADQKLGFAPIPNSYGEEILPVGADIPMRYDKDGFRAPMENNNDSENAYPVLLALGCSFTYGAITYAKDTYPYLAGKYLGGSAKNAGICSYGLSQMVILAKKLIPFHKPNYVIVQYSTWLIDRSLTPFALSSFGKLPNPFFVEEKDMLKIHPPVFQTKIMELPVDEYRNSHKGFSDFISFLWNVGLPLFLHDDLNMSSYVLAKAFRSTPDPAANREKVIKYAYEKITRVAEDNGAKVIIVILGSSHHAVQIQKDLFPEKAILVDAHSALLKKLPVINEESYIRQYGRSHGDPPTMIDPHPNEKAHRIIAEEIVQQIKQNFGTQLSKSM